MKTKKLLALLMTGAMVVSMTACGSTENAETVESVATESTVAEEAPAEEAATPSIDFEDGLYGFVGLDSVVNPAGDAATLELVDYNGSKALKATPTEGKSMFIGIQADALLGDDIAKLATVEMTIGIENPDGTFQSASGNIYGLVGENNDQTSEAWAVYLENANPKTVSYSVPDGYTLQAGNYIVVSLESDTGRDAGMTAANLYIDNIAFLDASGNTLAADSSAEFVVADTGEDRSNLFGISNAVTVEGFAVTGDAWSQNGIDLSEDAIAALTEDSVIEISYTSETGNMWLVFPGSAAGWMRIGVGDCDGSGQGYSYVNGSKNIAQVDYATIAEYLGDDVSTWGTTLQCESDGAWEVYSVKIGSKSPNYVLTGAVEAEGFSVSGDGWAQNGVDVSEDFLAKLVPGSAIEIDYTSETGEIWLVFPGSSAGWMRIGVGDYDGSGQGYAVCDGSHAQITYDTIAEYLGEDVSAWGTTLQCEATSAWEVYSVTIGQAQ